ncbi:MAG TPA: alkyl sulfatase dimerization domain-containing protein [Sphingobium sp.]|uniref:alkyl sulfatase dimerization domain-containing protein n=1 Tax=Sphingobium sp. TaxID=1912891 RepID=UPI002ED45825
MADRQRDPGQPLNAQIVNDGAGRQDAVDLGQGIFMSKDVSNLYRILTPEGDVQINTGMIFNVEENVRRFEAISDHPLKVIVFTQSHEDHIGGWTRFNAPGVETIAQANFAHVRGYFKDTGIGPTMARRSRRLWSGDVKKTVTERPEPVITTSFHDSHAFEVGGRRFELYAVPGGETLDSLVVWMPEERTVFTGNMTGPLFGHVPNLYTVRGDKIRSAQRFIDAVQRVMDLKPEMLVTGHGEPVKGEAEIQKRLGQIRDATIHIRDKTFEGMNAGVDLWTLMGSVTLPPELNIPQGHGKLPWLVRAIWEEHLGWFRYESTTELYNVPPQAVSADFVELAGGTAPVLARAQVHLDAGRPLEAMHLTEAALSVEADNRDAQRIQLGATETILDRSGRENFSEVRWLEGEIRRLKAALEENAA